MEDVSIKQRADPAHWQPTKGLSWQIILLGDNGPLDLPVDVYDIDMYNTNGKAQSDINTLKSNGKKVICYFSAGTTEDWRDDYDQFDHTPGVDEGGKVKQEDGETWSGELWANTKSDNVRKVMKARITKAKQLGCDAIDPDNMDAYDNEGGGFTPELTLDNAKDYLQFLTTEAHTQGMAIGLKNAKDLVNYAISIGVDFAVNEECSKYKECGDQFQNWITASPAKPVFHIEYPNDGKFPCYDNTTDAAMCTGNGESGNPTNNLAGWSTVLKDADCQKGLMLCDGKTYAMDKTPGKC